VSLHLGQCGPFEATFWRVRSIDPGHVRLASSNPSEPANFYEIKHSYARLRISSYQYISIES
jgi:hypothetical protein